MPAWLVILLLIELVILLTNPNERDYSWLQGLRRPGWLTFHIWSPMIRFACYAGLYLALLVIHSQQQQWNLVITGLLLIALNEASVWITCRMRSLALGTLIGAVAWVLFLSLTLAVSRVSQVAAVALLPYLLWTFIDLLAQWQMIGLNTLGDDQQTRRSVSSYRTLNEEVERLRQSMARRRRPR